jgi:hypothetical protein
VAGYISATVCDDHFSTHVPGIIGFMRYMQQSGDKNAPCTNFNIDKALLKLQKSDTCKRKEVNRTLIGINKSETHGYKLERREDFKVPVPRSGNNYYKNHSQISKASIFRDYKGPLYNEAGRICIELT